VEVGPEQGLPNRGVINCDNVITIPKTALEPSPVGHLDHGKRAELDRALRYSLDVIY
jgi:mRNA-degrading endonuclease toxin of MazEF toxin-antitoxin module